MIDERPLDTPPARRITAHERDAALDLRRRVLTTVAAASTAGLGVFAYLAAGHATASSSTPQQQQPASDDGGFFGGGSSTSSGDGSNQGLTAPPGSIGFGGFGGGSHATSGGS